MPSPSRGLTQPERVELSGRLLLSAAAALIVEKGWEATTAAEIGRRAGYSRAMVHARYGSKDAILDALFRDQYLQRFGSPTDRAATGLEEALGPLTRIEDLYHENPESLRAMFVMCFEAVKTTSPLRSRMQTWLEDGSATVRAGLRTGIEDGSVRADTDVDRTVDDVTTAIFGLAFRWTVLPQQLDLLEELHTVRDRIHGEIAADVR